MRIVAAGLGCLLMGACGSSRTYESDPRALLGEAKSTVDSAKAVHFSITSSGVPGSGTVITGGQGDARRPDGFAGSISVVLNGLPVNIAILSVGGTFYVKLPFTSTYSPTDPSKYGFSDPAKLIDPDHGLSTLLVSAKTARLGDRDRIGGEEVYEIQVALPGDLVKALLTSADPAQDVKGTVAVDVDNHQVRRVVLTGPFFDAQRQSTYTLVLDNYGENVTITPPASANG
jgi:hypothetical protein